MLIESRACSLDRRNFLQALAAAPLFGMTAGQARPAGEIDVSGWAPAAGCIVPISYPPGRHPLGRGATLAEISPAVQAWNPLRPSVEQYGNRWYGWHTYGNYCGSAFNADARQIVLYGAGHASINICAPCCFDLNERRWKWLDRPLPFDANAMAIRSGYPQPLGEAKYREFYPPEQVDYLWGEVKGGWTGWPARHRRPGRVQPIPTHSRGTLVHIRGATYGNRNGALLYYGKATGLFSDTHSVASHLFDFDTGCWQRTANAFPGQGMSFYGCVADDETGKVIVFGNGNSPSARYCVLDVATRLWTVRKASLAIAVSTDHPGNVLHQMSRLLIVPARTDALSTSSGHAGKARMQYRFFATPIDAIVGSGSFAPTELIVKVESSWPLTSQGDNRYLGWSYCPDDACLYIINGEHGSDKYWRLAPPADAVTQRDYLAGTWTLTEHVFLTGALSSPGGRPRSMMFNRMQWDAASRSFVWWPDSIDGPVQAWRPSMI